MFVSVVPVFFPTIIVLNPSSFVYKGGMLCQFLLSVGFFVYVLYFCLASYLQKKSNQPKNNFSGSFKSISRCHINLLQSMREDNNIPSINFKIISFNLRGLNNSIKQRKSLSGFISKPLTAIFSRHMGTGMGGENLMHSWI